VACAARRNSWSGACRTKALREHTRIILREADRLTALVDAMLGPTRPSQLQPVNIHDWWSTWRGSRRRMRPPHSS